MTFARFAVVGYVSVPALDFAFRILLQCEKDVLGSLHVMNSMTQHMHEQKAKDRVSEFKKSEQFFFVTQMQRSPEKNVNV
jgi:hypothetical protein